MTDRKKYKNLLFDLGGVIMDLDRSRCVAAFTDMGMTTANDLLGEYIQAGPFLALEEGKLSSAEFRDECRAHLTHPATDNEIDYAFNQFLIGIPLHRLRSIDALKESYNIYLLSNTNQIMWDSKIKECFMQDGKEREDYFDGMVTSFEAGCAKPDSRIFQLTLEKFNILPEETLFFDDGQKNIDAASKLGFGTHLIKPGEEFMDYFSR